MTAIPSEPPLSVAAAPWRGNSIGQWYTLDRELPDAGWPCRNVCELLSAQPAVLE
ncbi:MAG: hypothetical protein AB7S98_23090 [Burkholderiaceae bacterium]